VGELKLMLSSKIRAASVARLRGAETRVMATVEKPKAGKLAADGIRPASSYDPSLIIAIGASTGGTEAIADVLCELPDNLPGIVITQHIPPNFSRAFAERLNRISKLEVREAVDGDEVVPGLALVAPGDFHMLLRKRGDKYCVAVKDGPRVCYQRPSVDVLFGSVAEAAGASAIGVLLTGMGSDGANGMVQMKRAGGLNIAQDEASCVVFGMPREAIRMGVVDRVLPLPRIAGAILSSLSVSLRA